MPWWLTKVVPTKNRLYKVVYQYFLLSLGPLFIVSISSIIRMKILILESHLSGRCGRNTIFDVYKQTDQNILVNFTADWCLDLQGKRGELFFNQTLLMS